MAKFKSSAEIDDYHFSMGSPHKNAHKFVINRPFSCYETPLSADFTAQKPSNTRRVQLFAAFLWRQRDGLVRFGRLIQV